MNAEKQVDGSSRRPFALRFAESNWSKVFEPVGERPRPPKEPKEDEPPKEPTPKGPWGD